MQPSPKSAFRDEGVQAPAVSASSARVAVHIPFYAHMGCAQSITLWVKLASRLDRNFKSVRRFALPADGRALAAAAVSALFPDGSYVDVAETRVYRVHTNQAQGLVPLPIEEQSAFIGACFSFSTPVTRSLDGAFFVVDATCGETVVIAHSFVIALTAYLCSDAVPWLVRALRVLLPWSTASDAYNGDRDPCSVCSSSTQSLRSRYSLGETRALLGCSNDAGMVTEGSQALASDSLPVILVGTSEKLKLHVS